MTMTSVNLALKWALTYSKLKCPMYLVSTSAALWHATPYAGNYVVLGSNVPSWR